MKGGTFLSLFCRHLRRLMRLNNRVRGPAKIIEMGCGKNFRLSACDKGPLGDVRLMMLMIFVKWKVQAIYLFPSNNTRFLGFDN